MKKMHKFTGLVAALLLQIAEASANFEGPAIKVDAKQNASGVVLNCVSTAAVIKGYEAAGRGSLVAAQAAGCVLVPDGAAVSVDCTRTSRVFARIRYMGRIGWTSNDHLTMDCRR
jgi:hypothetical protein